MHTKSRLMMRRQLDRRFQKIKNLETLENPQQGWLRTIREALGMTMAQLGQRLGVSQPRVKAIEKAEAGGSITLNTLERAAQAMGCRVIYNLVPHQSLEKLIEERARILADKQLKTARHTMLLEDQAVKTQDERDQADQLIRNIIEQASSKLWDDIK